ncbi:MAG: hypothetical protein WKF82_02080 [Nocardioidaceae bacterium]
MASGDSSGESDLQEALQLARAHNLTGLVIRINDALGSVKYLTESASASIPFSEEAVTVAADRGHMPAFFFCSANLAESLAVAGRIDEALAVCERAARELADADKTRHAALLRMHWAWVLTIRGDFQQANALIGQALPIIRGAEPARLAEALMIALDCAEATPAQAPNHDTAADLMGEVVTALQNPDVDADLAQSLPRLARLLIPAGHPELIRRIIDHSPTGILFDNIVLAARAVLAEGQGEYADGLALYHEAASAWASYGYPARTSPRAARGRPLQPRPRPTRPSPAPRSPRHPEPTWRRTTARRDRQAPRRARMRPELGLVRCLNGRACWAHLSERW